MSHGVRFEAARPGARRHRQVRTPARARLTYPARPGELGGAFTSTFAAYCDAPAGAKLHKIYAVAMGYGPVLIKGPTRRYSA